MEALINFIKETFFHRRKTGFFAVLTVLFSSCYLRYYHAGERSILGGLWGKLFEVESPSYTLWVAVLIFATTIGRWLEKSSVLDLCGDVLKWFVQYICSLRRKIQAKTKIYLDGALEFNITDEARGFIKESADFRALLCRIFSSNRFYNHHNFLLFKISKDGRFYYFAQFLNGDAMELEGHYIEQFSEYFYSTISSKNEALKDGIFVEPIYNKIKIGFEHIRFYETKKKSLEILCVLEDAMLDFINKIMPLKNGKEHIISDNFYRLLLKNSHAETIEKAHEILQNCDVKVYEVALNSKIFMAIFKKLEEEKILKP